MPSVPDFSSRFDGEIRPGEKFFHALGPIGDDQIEALAKRRGFPPDRMKELFARPDFPVKTT